MLTAAIGIIRKARTVVPDGAAAYRGSAAAGERRRKAHGNTYAGIVDYLDVMKEVSDLSEQSEKISGRSPGAARRPLPTGRGIKRTYCYRKGERIHEPRLYPGWRSE